MEISISLGSTRRKKLPGISPRSWEHPADHATLAALKKVPGLDQVLQRFVGATTERSLRLITLASAVRVTDRQFPKLNRIYKEACSILDAPHQPELYVSQNPFLNARAIGMDHPFIVLHSSVVDSLSEDEMMCILGHELGHVLSGHALYKTLLQLLVRFSTYAMAIPLGGVSILAVIMALREWDRKSELSADRAGLLTVQDPDVSYTLEMKLAGGARVSEMDMNEFFLQAAEYEAGGNVVDSIYKLMNLAMQTHPFPVLRLTELKSWVDAGEYGKILSGAYMHRDSSDGDTVYEKFKDAGQQYRDDFDKSKDPLADALRTIYDNTEGARTKAKEVFDSFFGGEKK